MSSASRFGLWLVGCLLVVGMSGSEGWANFIDVVDTRDGVQSYGWELPKTITVYIPNEIAGGDKDNFKMGVSAWVACLPGLTIEYKDGEPEAGADCFVDINVTSADPPFPAGSPPPYAIGGGFVPDPYPADKDHVFIDEGVISIHPDALGHSGVAGSFMKNLGAHEFGHILGLDDDRRTEGDRKHVMDPDFRLIDDGMGNVIRADPFLSPSARDKMMLSKHYTVVPTPSGLAGLVLLGLVGMSRRG
ncbi:hypothetical protein [Mucisphaera sp.]|uniref:hypothetical protein n=1 Tax=Mucisphaera sp. TaxID=2913024 RepID=UPI003D0E26C4